MSFLVQLVGWSRSFRKGITFSVEGISVVTELSELLLIKCTGTQIRPLIISVGLLLFLMVYLLYLPMYRTSEYLSHLIMHPLLND